jgi:predicted dehydrogenase
MESVTMAKNTISRRHFFFGTLLAGAIPRAGFGSVPSLKALGYQSPNEKLNVAGIGAGAQAFSDLRQCETENIVALADVDWVRGEPGFQRYDKAAKYKDFRQMLDKDGKSIDAVVIGIPDHMHTHAALWCMERGKGVYVEKPLTRIASEARLLRQAAQKYKVATQMGNQGYSHEATRVASEIVWSGEIGDVREVHAWMSRPSWPQGMTKTPPATPVPATLDWDLWLGTAAFRPFTVGDQEYKDFVTARSAARRGGGAAAGPRAAAPAGGTPPAGAAAPTGSGGARSGGGAGGDDFGFYLPFNWRGFYDFGSSLIGDWGVHILGPANWALGLSPENLISVECIKKDELPPFTFPDIFTIKFEFKARKGMPPVTVYWYQYSGGDAYVPEGMTAEDARKIPNTGPQVGPARAGGTGRAAGAAGAANAGGAAGARGAAGAAGAAGGQGARGGAPQGSGYNCIFVGSKGYLGTSGRGEGVGLLPGSRWADYTLPPQFLTRSPGHHRDWIRACKGGAPACSQFETAAPYTEWLVLGSAAVRVNGKLLYDAKTGLFTNSSEANRHLRLDYRKGWEVKV